MTLHTENVRYGSNDEYLAYVARETRVTTPMPAVIVLQEAWGVNAHIEDVTRRFAQAGYVAVAPDLFAKNGVRPAPLSHERIGDLVALVNSMPMGTAFDPQKRAEALATRDAAYRARIEESFGALMAGLNLETYVPQLLATTAYLRHDFAHTRGQGIASVGFCMGGGLSALLSTHDPELRGAVVFYGNPPGDNRIAHIQCPVLDFCGSKDARILATLPGFAEKMKSAGKRFEHHIYEGAEHAFFNDARPVYDVRATRDSFARTCSFLASVLA